MIIENYALSTEYREMADEVISDHPDLQWIVDQGVLIDFVVSSKEKKKAGGLVLGECKLVKEIYQLYCDYDFLIIIYAPNVCHLNREQMKILLYHELLHVWYRETKTGIKFTVKPHDIEDFRTILERYGLNWSD